MEEEIFIPLIMFSFILSLVWMIINYSKWKIQHKQEMGQASDNSLGMSELKDLMREAVEEGTEPLFERIEALEKELRRAQTPRLMPAQRDEILEEVNQAPVKEAEPAQRRA